METLNRVTANEGCTRCSTCRQLPEIIREMHGNRERFILRCERHGHMVIGYSVTEAVKHWNMYFKMSAEA